MIKIPKTEYQVMKFIWSQKSSKVSSKEIGDYMLEKFNWIKPTTAKVLSRLVEKDFLQHEKEGRNITYTVLVKENEYVKFETEEFFDFVHNKSLTSIVSTLGDGDSISDEDIKELEEWIKNR
ncbi:BlaI/MecI/CopY family transcriptional regulator [Clostridium sp. CCUG 7971]|uniref:BlaI/MecI/CopY family transcriptional regulator n=1 Tax=Clostridium sp. CCUG 7971 TaxID=2811414 RepID=UPI001ABAE66D|nr:BlaI/MecI/CopY family transcriptional regulator [Clostridium sp. CCUG 7971]MBO3444315.1 BlaI/MecI/CopY family transcriptional regulator [Clostridium sp. CCUG 7971]